LLEDVHSTHEVDLQVLGELGELKTMKRLEIDGAGAINNAVENLREFEGLLVHRVVG
jgi:hypothetical protein